MGVVVGLQRPSPAVGEFDDGLLLNVAPVLELSYGLQPIRGARIADDEDRLSSLRPSTSHGKK